METYQSTLESISAHPLPDWFQDAKLGIFVHYGLFSVPGWAVVSEGDITQTIRKMGWSGHFRNNPYAEWYLNTLRIGNSPTQEYHRRTYGPNFTYNDFVPMFQAANASWDPTDWADTFARTGARYVVLTSKHCESFALWPTAFPNPFYHNYTAKRDIVGELSMAVRARGMRMGIYYCGGFDWCFNTTPIQNGADLALTIPQSEAYIQYCTSHWLELIDRYEPAVMWGDVGFPSKADVLGLFAHYYNRVPDGVINDRFYQVDAGLLSKLIRIPGMHKLINWVLAKSFLSGKSSTRALHSDFTTPEYTSHSEIVSGKWEACRGLGYSFGYNRNETSAHMLSVQELVHMFVDVVSKNGNLLLNVGPTADGSISKLQLERLEGLGSWLAVNGEAIYGTRPWLTAEGKTQDGLAVRYTQKADSLYAILLGNPRGASITIEGLGANAGMSVRLLGSDAPVQWELTDGGISIALPENLPDQPALVAKLSPPPALTTANKK